MSGLFRRKAIADLQQEAGGEHGMKRALGPVNLTAIGIGGIIGAGIFVLTGTAAAQNAGPAVVLSFVAAGIACAFAGLCYAEFASMIPIAGSAYTYAYATLGEFFAWFIGWDLVLEYAMGASTVAVGWSGYFVSFLRGIGIEVPPKLAASVGAHLVNVPSELVQSSHLAISAGWQTINQYPCGAGMTAPAEGLCKYLLDNQVPVDQHAHATGLFNLPAVLIVLAVTALLVIGIRESANFNAAVVVLKVAVVITVIAVGVAFVKSANWHPFIPASTGEFGKFGWSGVLRGAGVVFFAYIGFDAVSTAAQEAKNPQRDMPIGILGSLIICTVLYILVSLVLTGVVSYTALNVPHPIAVAVDAMGLGWLATIVELGAIAGLTSVILVLLMGQPRIFFSMSKDGLLPPIFSRLHPKYGTPHVTTIVTGIIVAIVAGAVPIGILGELVSIGTLSAFVIVCAGIIVLRARHPELPRPFRTPGVPIVPALGMFSCFGLMVFLPLDTWIRLFVWLAAGVAIYLLYGVRNSKLAQAAAARTNQGN